MQKEYAHVLEDQTHTVFAVRLTKIMIAIVHTLANSPVVEGSSAPIITPGQVFAEADQPAHVARQSTGAMASLFRKLEKWVVTSGLCSCFTYLVIGFVFVWLAWQVPETCNARLAVVFLVLGMINWLMGGIVICYVSVARTMLSAMAHGAKADKYRFEGRDDEATSEESDYEAEARQAARVLIVPTALYFVALNALVACWVFGIYQASLADDFLCNGAPFMFWMLLAINIINLCMSSKVGSAAYQPPIGRLLEEE